MAVALLATAGGAGAQAPPGAPGTPQTLNAVVSGNTVTLSWTPNGAAASSYTLSAALTPAGPALANFTVATSSVTVTSVPVGTYYVRVAASNAFGSSAPSDAVAVVVGGQAPSFPLTVTNVNVQQIGSLAVSSSTRLSVNWPAPATPVSHYTIVATDVTGMASTSTVAAGTTGATLTNLKANTSYTVTVIACADSACAQFASGTGSGTTAREYWQLQGSGNTVNGLTALVSDGNVRISATRFGPDAGAMAGRVQLYYGPRGAPSQLAAGVAGQPADASNPASYFSFTSRAGVSGLSSPSTATPLVTTVLTGQGVPMTSAMGARVRLFFEAQGADGKARVMWLDSRDGYVGQDFNAGTGTTCATITDYQSGGCVPTVAIGVQGDSVAPNSRIINARQHKIGWPILDNPHWDGAAGTFMVFTTDAVSGCSASTMNHGYAVWQGVTWSVQYASNGCPKLFTSAQAAFPMHVGGGRYKMYYGDPSIQSGRVSGSQLPFLGPKKLIYADGQLTGSANVVDFEDWEPQNVARDVAFLWPSGEMLDDRAEGYIDDYHFLAPTGGLDLQVMYLAITDGTLVPVTAGAVLRNP
jgi:hypothetical protein